MRSKRLDLEDVAGEFEAWRANREERRIPETLLAVAVKLLDRHAPSAICRRLRLSPQRFKEACAEHRDGRRSGAVAVGARPVVSSGRDTGRETAVAARVPRRAQGFVEVRPMMLAPSASALVPLGCRLTLESAGCTVTVVAAAAPDTALLEAVCRMALGMLGPRA